MKKTFIVISLFSFIFLFSNNASYAFESGPVLNIVAEIGGSSTMPSIGYDDLKMLGANKMEGMTGFIANGMAEIGYIFGVKQFMGFDDNDKFSGIGLFGHIGVGDGYAGQISGSFVEGEQVDVFFNVYYSPVISAGLTIKSYFFKNRLAVGLSAGVKVVADTQPAYEMYSSHPNIFPPTVGTIIVEDWMVKEMNPIMVNLKMLIDYNIPLLNTLEVILGGYFGFNIYKPKYITMPGKLLDSAIGQGFDPKEPVESYYINSLEYGLRVGLGMKL